MNESDNIVFFGGAGTSTESGIPDFRSSNGLFNEKLNKKFTPEQLVSHSFYVMHPEEFFSFYKDKLIYKNAKPNNAHIALAELEKRGKLKAIITQNIDGLHQMAGSKNVYELHGSVHRNYCMKCGKFYSATEVLKSVGIPKCECGGTIKPDVVLYEEGLNDEILENSVKAIMAADVLIVGGTSLSVYPASGLIRYYRGKKLVLINKTPTNQDGIADMVINEGLGLVMKDIL
ncbi:MAG: NAD-dependent protein deacylase [Oscillospiraceae bacterium]